MSKRAKWYGALSATWEETDQAYDHFKVSDKLINLIDDKYDLKHYFQLGNRFKYTGGTINEGPNGTDAFHMIYLDDNGTEWRRRHGHFEVHRKTSDIRIRINRTEVHVRPQMEIPFEQILFGNDYIIFYFHSWKVG